MNTDKNLVLQKIKNTFKSQTNIPNNLRLPREIEFIIRGNDIEMFLTKDAVGRNMQEDKSSFEGWALVLKRWGKFDKIILSWEKPHYDFIGSEAAHYQRFLFRAKHFSTDFKAWFSISSNCLAGLTDHKIDDVTDYYLSPPFNERDKSDVQGAESVLEYKFSIGEWSNALKLASNAKYLNRQLPVGIFYPPVSNKTSILPKNKSAIDIWGISNNNELLIFELKADGNNKVGIITELYFYCCVMQRIRNGQFKYERYHIVNLDRIAKTNKIIGYFLAPGLHPLIDVTLIDLLNKGTNLDMEFHYLRFPKQGGTPIDFIY